MSQKQSYKQKKIQRIIENKIQQKEISKLNKPKISYENTLNPINPIKNNDKNIKIKKNSKFKKLNDKLVNDDLFEAYGNSKKSNDGDNFL